MVPCSGIVWGAHLPTCHGPLWLGTPDSGIVERAETQVGTGAQKRTIARRGLFFAGRRAAQR